MTPKISMIIPVYKTEKFLERCLDSAVNQTLKEIEIIVINDASPDGSLDIIHKYQHQDDRIQLIDFKENKGNGFGRNAAVNKATGEYIFFLDSDDWLELNAAELAYSKAKSGNYELVLFGFTHRLENPMRHREDNVVILPTWSDDDDDFYKYFLLHQKGLYSMPWVYLYKRELVVKHNVSFSVGIYFEDVAFVSRALYFAKNMGVVKDIPLYNYLIRKNSITQSLSKKKIMDHFTAHDLLGDFLKEVGGYEKYEKEFITRYIVFCSFLNFWDYYNMSDEQRDEELDAKMKKIRKGDLLSFKNLNTVRKFYNKIDKNEHSTRQAYKMAGLSLGQMKYSFFIFKNFMKLVRYGVRKDEEKRLANLATE